MTSSRQAESRKRQTQTLVHRQSGGEQVFIKSASILERVISRPASTWTEHDLEQAFVTLDLRQVSLMHVGGHGKLKTLDFVPRDHNHFLHILRYGERADGSSLFSGSGISSRASDIVLRPRIPSAFVDPFSDEGTLAVLCSHETCSGEPLPQSPDSIVRKAYDRLLKVAGFELHALGEVEFFLGCREERNPEPDTEDRGYHAAAPFVEGQELRRRALTLLAEIGVPLKYAHSEVGFALADDEHDVTWEQHEVELGLAPLPQAADNVALTQWVLRNLAREYELLISFEPVVRRGHAGNGMHFHLAPFADKRFIPVFQSGKKVSHAAELLLSGLLINGCSLMAFGNRAATSFVRLFQGKESPTSVTWGQFNRKALVRLPVTTTDASGAAVSPETIEFRLPDSSASPHLLLAGIAQAATAAHASSDTQDFLDMMHCDMPAAKDSQAIPTSGKAVANLLRKSRATYQAADVFPENLIEAEIARLESQVEIDQ